MLRDNAVDQRFDAFIKEYIELAFRESNFILHKIDNAQLLNVTDEVSEKTEIHMRYKEKEFQEFLVRRCKPIKDDQIIVQHHEAQRPIHMKPNLEFKR